MRECEVLAEIWESSIKACSMHGGGFRTTLREKKPVSLMPFFLFVSKSKVLLMFMTVSGLLLPQQNQGVHSLI